MSGIDWSKAPDGAMRFKNTNNDCRWLKKVSELVFFCEYSEWYPYGNQTIGLNHWNNATPRPDSTTQCTVESSRSVDWSDAFDGATHALVTGPDWINDNPFTGQTHFAKLINGEYMTQCESEPFVIGNKFWQVIEARPTITTNDVDDTVTQRGERYGLFADGAVIMQDLKAVMRATPGWERLTPSQREALEMIQHKIGRVLNGDPMYVENFTDIAGYAILVKDEMLRIDGATDAKVTYVERTNGSWVELNKRTS